MSARQEICNHLMDMCLKHNMEVEALEYDSTKNDCYVRVDTKGKFVDCSTATDDNEFKKLIANAIKSMQRA